MIHEKISNPPRVMVVDDNKSDLYLISEILKSFDCEVEEVEDSLLAVDRAEQINPDAIVLDVQMPNVDGFELCRILKNHAVLNDVPVIFLTNSGDVSSRVQGLACGGTDYLLKPVQPKELQARVMTQIRLCRTQQDLHIKNKILEEKIQALEVAGAALRDSETRLESVFNNAAVCIALVDNNGRYEMVNDRCADLFGYSREEMANMSCWHLIDHAYHAHTRLIMKELTDGFDNKKSATIKFIRKNGKKFQGECYLTSRYDAVKECFGFVCVIIDLSEKRKAENKLRLANTVFENCSEGLMICDAENSIKMVNPAFSTITGYSSGEVIGRNPRILKSNKQDASFYRKMWKHLLQHDQWKGEIWNRRKNGDIYPEQLSISVLRSDKGHILNYVSVFSDITRQKRFELLLQLQAQRDSLTNLLNRAAFNDRLRSELARAKRSHHSIALMYIDLDNFKEINDSRGHLEGDIILQNVAALLKRFFRISDIIARLGGDEFVVVLPSVKDKPQVNRIIERLYRNIQSGSEKSPGVTFCTGIALFPVHGTTPDLLLKKADDAMYAAKRLGKGRYCFAKQEST